MSTATPGASRQRNWFARHKIWTSIIGLVLFVRLVDSCSGDDSETAALPPVTSTSVPAPVTTTSAPAPAETTQDPAASASASAAAKKAAEKRAADQRKEAAAAKKAAEKRAAEKKREAAAAKKAAAEKAAVKKAAKQREARRQAAAEERAREEAALTFANCTAMHARYPHGVGLPGAIDDTSGTPVTSFTRSTKIYNLNSGSDQDDDRIACEKR